LELGGHFELEQGGQIHRNMHYIKLVSYNEHHAPQEYPIDALKKWAIVKASIRINAT